MCQWPNTIEGGHLLAYMSLPMQETSSTNEGWDSVYTQNALKKNKAYNSMQLYT